MYKKIQPTKSTMEINNSVEGETIEEKLRRIFNNKEPITDGAPLTYTERKDGVLPGHDIRTDRFEIAVEAMDKVQKSKQAAREERMKSPEQKEAEKKAAEESKNRADEAKTGMKNEGEA